MTSGIDKTFQAGQVAEVLKTVADSQSQPAGKSGGRLYVCIKDNALVAANEETIQKEGLKKLPLNSIATIAKLSVNNAINAKSSFAAKDIKDVVHSIKILYSKHTQDTSSQHAQEWKSIHELMNKDQAAGKEKAQELIDKMHQDATEFKLYDETLTEIENKQKAFDQENLKLLKKPTEAFVAALPNILKTVAGAKEVAKANKSLTDSIGNEYAKYLTPKSSAKESEAKAKDNSPVLNSFEGDVTRDLTFSGTDKSSGRTVILAPRAPKDSDDVQVNRATSAIKTAVGDDHEWEVPLQCALTQSVGNCVFGNVIGQSQQFLANERMKPGGLPNHLNLSLSYENNRLPPIKFTINRDETTGKITSIDFEFKGTVNLATRNSQYIPAANVLEGSLKFRMEMKDTKLPVYDESGPVRELFDSDNKPIEVRNDLAYYKGTNTPVPTDKQVYKMQTVRGPVISQIQNRLTLG